MKNGAWLGFIADLVGGFNQLEKYESQWKGLSHMYYGKKCLKPPASDILWYTKSLLVDFYFWHDFVLTKRWNGDMMKISWKHHRGIFGSATPNKVAEKCFQDGSSRMVVPLCFPDIFQVSNRIPTSLSCLVMLYPCIKLFELLYIVISSHMFTFLYPVIRYTHGSSCASKYDCGDWFFSALAQVLGSTGETRSDHYKSG